MLLAQMQMNINPAAKPLCEGPLSLKDSGSLLDYYCLRVKNLSGTT